MCSGRDVETRHVPGSLNGTLKATRTLRLDLLELSHDGLFGKCLVEETFDWLQAVLSTMSFSESHAKDIILFVLETDTDNRLPEVFV
jgi:hypothetical protein